MIESAWRQVGKFFCQFDRRCRHHAEVVVVEGQLAHLVRRGFNKFPPAIAEGDVTDAGETVEDLIAL